MCWPLSRHEELEEKKDKAEVIEKVIPHRRFKEAGRKVKRQQEKCEPLKQVAVRLCVCASVCLESAFFDHRAWPLHLWPEMQWPGGRVPWHPRIQRIARPCWPCAVATRVFRPVTRIFRCVIRQCVILEEGDALAVALAASTPPSIPLHLAAHL